MRSERAQTPVSGLRKMEALSRNLEEVGELGWRPWHEDAVTELGLFHSMRQHQTHTPLTSFVVSGGHVNHSVLLCSSQGPAEIPSHHKTFAGHIGDSGLPLSELWWLESIYPRFDGAAPPQILLPLPPERQHVLQSLCPKHGSERKQTNGVVPSLVLKASPRRPYHTLSFIFENQVLSALDCGFLLEFAICG